MKRWALIFAIILQTMTNALFMRRFTVALGVLKERGPAVVLSVHRTLFGRSERLLMDVYSFLEIAKLIGESDHLESSGFVINKKGSMQQDFTIPSWAFPRAQLEILMCGEEIVQSFKAIHKSTEQLLGVFKELGLPEEEIQKLRDKLKGKNPPRE